jgi:hypothetical protein
MIALVLLSIVSGGIYRVLVTNQQTYLAQTQRIDLQENLRAAVTVLPAEFRELDATDGDIIAMGTSSITMRAMRQLGVICSPPILGGGLGGVGLTIRQTPFYALRQFNVATDQLLVFYEGDEATRNDDSWVLATIVSVASQNCPDGRPGWRLTVNPNFVAGQLNVAGSITDGAPVKGFEVVKYELYQAPPPDSRYYLGQTKSGSTQPLIGPLSGPSAFQLKYFNAAGAQTAVKTQVASIEIKVQGQTQGRVRDPTRLGVAYKTDSVVTRVALRNNARF